MPLRFPNTRSILFSAVAAFALTAAPSDVLAEPPEQVFPGANQRTPSRSHFFDWINSQYEGSTELHTLTNLEFFQWMHDEFGMVLDVYSLDVGNIDDGPYTAGVGRLIPAHYGTMESEQFKRQFPRGFRPLVDKAAAFGCRLGIWLGPDGFGDTPAASRRRADMLVSLCRDYNFLLFKLDSVAGTLRPEKQQTLVEALKTCRSHCPDLIVLNERLDLGKAAPYATTSLWEGVETYIDVFMSNTTTAPHHRAGALERCPPPGLTRLLEDHGVCLSSCLDYWDDDLVLQAFNRGLVMAPQIYGNPWFLKDDEFPKLARIFNLHRRYRDMLVSASLLPEQRYGPHAVARGDATTRFITLRNLTWEPVSYSVQLDASIGLERSETVELRRLHPSERIIGRFAWGREVEVKVPPFRSCLLLAAGGEVAQVAVEGCDYEVVRDLPGEPVRIKLLGMPAGQAVVRLAPAARRFARAELDGQPRQDLLDGAGATVSFGGRALHRPWHRQVGELAPSPVPDDAEALYEATCFAADSNALEIRSLQRSGPTRIPAVRAARGAFLRQKMFVNRGIWDRNLFDGDLGTHFAARLADRTFRVDFGRLVRMDRLVIRTRDREAANLAPQLHAFSEDATAAVSSDLRTWTALAPSWGGVGTIAVIPVPAEQPIRYLRITGAPRRIAEIDASLAGRVLDRSAWRASNLLHPYAGREATAAWKLSFVPDEVAKNAVLAVAINGRHGSEGAYAALRVDGRPVGAPDRSVSYPSNTWEYKNVDSEENYTYYFPLPETAAGKMVDVVVLIMKGGEKAVAPVAWMTACPPPLESRELVLYPAGGS